MIDHTGIQVADLERSLEYYRTTLGLSEIERGTGRVVLGASARGKSLSLGQSVSISKEMLVTYSPITQSRCHPKPLP